MIISASRRTDIPAFYSEWFINRVRAGYCVSPNPFNPKQKTNPISLKPEDVDCFVFWTRNAEPMFKYFDELDDMGYKYYFLYTINAYPRSIELSAPDKDRAIETFQKLSSRLGKERVIWRYDPLLYFDEIDKDWHVENIEYIADRLSNYTERMIFSIIQPYRKTKSRLGKVQDSMFDVDTYAELIEWIGANIPKRSIDVFSCAEEHDFSIYGINKSSCIDPWLIKCITGKDVDTKKDPGQRKECRCCVSRDIGVNSTCLFGCKYCYATISDSKAHDNFKKHDPTLDRLL